MGFYGNVNCLEFSVLQHSSATRHCAEPGQVNYLVILIKISFHYWRNPTEMIGADYLVQKYVIQYLS